MVKETPMAAGALWYAQVAPPAFNLSATLIEDKRRRRFALAGVNG
jgi:hypothetical protein